MQPTNSFSGIQIGSDQTAFHQVRPGQARRNVEDTIRLVTDLFLAIDHFNSSEDSTEPSDKRSISPLDAPLPADQEGRSGIERMNFLIEIIRSKLDAKAEIIDHLNEVTEKKFPCYPVQLMPHSEFDTYTLNLLKHTGIIKVKEFFISKNAVNLPIENIKLLISRKTENGFKDYVLEKLPLDDADALQKMDLQKKAATLGIAPATYGFIGDEEALVTKISNVESLVGYINSHELTPNQGLDLLKQIINSVKTLHTDMDVAHRNITPDAFLIKKSGEPFKVLFADFFTATVENTSKKYARTKDFVAPEVYFKKLQSSRGSSLAYDTKKADCYSLGITLFELATAKSFQESFEKIGCSEKLNAFYLRAIGAKSLDVYIENITPIIDLVINRHLNKFPRKLRVTIQGLLQPNPSDRITADEALALMNS